MHSVIILGTGNLAQHLTTAFSKVASIQLIQVYGRSQDGLKWFENHAETCSDLNRIKDADVHIIAVKDEAIRPVSKFLSSKKWLVVHTSGATDMDCIPLDNRGVFYPVQTFTKGKLLDFKNVPIGIEANHEKDLKVLEFVAQQISTKVYRVSSKQRKELHLAAVFANNFTNHLYRISEDICERADLPFDILKPLIQETAEKLQTLSPETAQTGPARRGDEISIQHHLNLINNNLEGEIYALFTEAIKAKYEEKL